MSTEPPGDADADQRGDHPETESANQEPYRGERTDADDRPRLVVSDPPPLKDPAKSFRGVAAAALVIEAIVVALALPVASKLGGGFADGTGWVVLGIVVALLATCAFLRYEWSLGVGLGLQVLTVCTWPMMAALGVVGVLFLLIWVLLLWMRADVLRRYRSGTLPAQQASGRADNDQRD